MLQETMKRGDIKWVRFNIQTPDGEPSPLNFTDIVFTVKAGVLNRTPLFQRSIKAGNIYKIGDGDYQLCIRPNDTRKLVFGYYVFDVQVEYKGVLKQSFDGRLLIESEVTYPVDENYDETEHVVTVPTDEEADDTSKPFVPEYITLSLETPVTVATSPDYNDLVNKPSIEGTELVGNLTAADLNLMRQNDFVPLTNEELDILISGGDLEEDG